MSFRINPELLNRGIFDLDRSVFAGDVIRPGTGGTGAGGPQPVGERVQPGDLITADLINHILARLEALENRPTPTVPTVTVPTFPTLTFPTIFTLPTFPTLNTFPTFPTIFTMPTFNTFPTFPTIFTMPTFATMPTNVLTMATIPGGLATNLATGLATGPGGLGNLGGPIGGITFRREDSTTSLPGIGRDEETRLRGAGIRNLGEVADADPVVLGNTLGMEPASAARVIGIARGALGPR